MKTATAALIALLNGSGGFNGLVMADLFTITLYTGTRLLWTTFDRALTFGGTTWLIGPPLNMADIETVIGTQVDAVKMSIYPSREDTLNGTLLSSLIVGGLLDGARVQIQRAYMATPNAPITGTTIQFVGNVGAGHWGPRWLRYRD